jgi:hypothetical protein
VLVDTHGLVVLLVPLGGLAVLLGWLLVRVGEGWLFVGCVVEVGGEAEPVLWSDEVAAAVGGGPGVDAFDVDGDPVGAVVGA